VRPFVREEDSGNGSIFLPSKLFIVDPFAGTHLTFSKGGWPSPPYAKRNTVLPTGLPTDPVDGELGARGFRDRSADQQLNP
jgi:hypothetical protein